MTEQRIYYRRHLPHYQPLEAEYHVVFRLAGSLPIEVIERLREQREAERKRMHTRESENDRQANQLKLNATYFTNFDRLLDNPSSGPR